MTDPLKSLKGYLEDEKQYALLMKEKEDALHSSLSKDAETKKIEFTSLTGRHISLNLPDTQYSKKRQYDQQSSSLFSSTTNQINQNVKSNDRMPYYYSVMSEIYRDEIEQKVKNDQEQDFYEGQKDQGPDTDQIKAQMLDNNHEMDQNADAAYHLSRELENQKKGNSGIIFREIKQTDQVQFDEKAYLERKMEKDKLLGHRANFNPSKNELSNNQLSAMALKQIQKDVQSLG